MEQDLTESRIEKVRAFDFFPRTRHVERLVLMTKR